MDVSAFNVLSLCSGIGGLDLGIGLAVPHARTICYVEIEAYACAVLAARMEEGWLDPAPVWSDLRTFEGRPWRGAVDLVVGGYPCQPFSTAGARFGAEDPRHLWPHVARIIDECAPSWVFLENVSGHVSLGLREVRHQLDRLGYRSEAGLFRAEEIGAPHRRERLFILAGRKDQLAESGRVGGELLRVTGDVAQAAGDLEGEEGEWQRSRDAARDRSAAMADTDNAGWDIGSGDVSASRRRAESANGSVGVADTHGEGLESERSSRLPDGRSSLGHDADGCGSQAAAVGNGNGAGLEGRSVHGSRRPYERAPWPPGPENPVGWRRYLDDWPGLEPAVLRGSDGIQARVDRLAACGNAVVPEQAAYAFRTLLGRFIS